MWGLPSPRQQGQPGVCCSNLGPLVQCPLYRWAMGVLESGETFPVILQQVGDSGHQALSSGLFCLCIKGGPARDPIP